MAHNDSDTEHGFVVESPGDSWRVLSTPDDKRLVFAPTRDAAMLAAIAGLPIGDHYAIVSATRRGGVVCVTLESRVGPFVRIV